MQPLIDHARSFGGRPEDLASPAQRRSPRVPFVTCSPSRVAPADACPGRPFTPRSAGAVVPPRGPRTGAVPEHRPDSDTFEAPRGTR
ncbi:hypothetical protein ACFV99_29610 [Streptomyces sp. NPDC059944]|uniref:hypothetical protein n=1 Tax=unclassified Streptomyces TaxID=2593676 RepID=UPI0036478D66